MKKNLKQHLGSMRSAWPVLIIVLLIIAVLFLSGEPAHAWRGTIGWTFKAESSITSGVAVAGDLVFVGDSTGNLYAVSKSSGQLVWKYHGTNSVIGTPSVITSAGTNGKVIFAQEDGTITCLDFSGSIVWKYTPPEESYAAETVADGTEVGAGKVYVVKGNGKLYALSLENGHTIWTYESEHELRNTPFFDSGSNLVMLGEQRGIFSAINPASGKRSWGGGAGGAINTPTVHDGSVFYSSWDGTVQRVKIAGVIPLWKDTKPNVGEPITTAPTVGGGRVFVGTATGKILALSEQNGAILWQFDTQGGNINARPVYTDSDGGLVFACGGQGVLSVLDAKSGQERFQFTTGAGIDGTPAFNGGVLYLGSGDGNLYAIL